MSERLGCIGRRCTMASASQAHEVGPGPLQHTREAVAVRDRGLRCPWGPGTTSRKGKSPLAVTGAPGARPMPDAVFSASLVLHQQLTFSCVISLRLMASFATV